MHLSATTAAKASSSHFGAHRRIFLHTDVLQSLQLLTGDLVFVSDSQTSKTIVGCAWPDDEVYKTHVALSPVHHLSLFSPDSKSRAVTIEPVTHSAKTPGKVRVEISHAVSIQIQELSPPPAGTQKVVTGRDRATEWLTLLLRETLVGIRYIGQSLIIPVTYEGVERTFEVASIKASQTRNEREKTLVDFQKLSIQPVVEKKVWKVSWDTDVSLAASVPPPSKPGTSEMVPVEDPYAVIGGLSPQITQIRELIEVPLLRPDLYRKFGLKPPRGILLYGPPGTGKTHLALTISRSFSSPSSSSTPKISTFHISSPSLHAPYHGETESALRSLFSRAREAAPSIIILDEVDALCPMRSSGDEGSGDGGSGVENRVVATLLGEMDGLDSEGGEEQRVVVIGTTNRVNAIDGALRRSGRFDREIDIGIPSAPARAEILRSLLRRTPHSLTSADIDDVASRSHGYVGADLAAVVRDAGGAVIRRILHPSPSHPSTSANPDAGDKITREDMLAALPLTPPSALRALTLPIQYTPWSSLGGASIQRIRARLNEAIAWPLLHPEAFQRLGVQAPRGVLMFGPPGCSKTSVGRALASEHGHHLREGGGGGVNWVGVRGPEMLSKYVGESERAIRELFKKARAAKPCIIFFDEIDALATSRSISGTSAESGILTSLLNEMDGIQDSSGVVVIGATNRPEVIDSALIRPGRLDRLIYVGPPSYEDRLQILRVKMADMSVEEGVAVEELARMTEGCSGAELNAMCRDAALLTMTENMEAPFIPYKNFVAAAQKVQKQITKELLEKYEDWRKESGVNTD